MTLLIQSTQSTLDETTAEKIINSRCGNVIHLSPANALQGTHRYSEWGDPLALENALENVVGPVEVLLLGFSPSDRIPTPWLNVLASREVNEILRVVFINESLTFHPHRPLVDVSARVLSVFPGPLIPTLMGSHQRAFQLISAAADESIYMDTLICGSKSSLKSARAILAQISPSVSTYHIKKRKLPRLMRTRRIMEAFLRKVSGSWRAPQNWRAPGF